MIAIIDYNAGNVTSVKRAMDFLESPSEITDNAEKILAANRIIFPGVGHAQAAMHMLKESGLDRTIKEAFERGIPILGICLGSQVILSHSEEGDTPCLGLIKGDCLKFSFLDNHLKIPHMGWNTIRIKQEHPVLREIKDGVEMYFVHSYFTQPDCQASVFASTDYGIEFPVAIGYRNMFATQFHPEKSGQFGLQILKNFLIWDGGKW